jgi:hypothetical protein
VLGSGSGGPAVAVARNLGTWVTGLESDADLNAAAARFIVRAQLQKKISLKLWDPVNPVFAPKSHHHCLALEPAFGPQPEPLLDGLANVLRPGGQLVLIGLATTKTADTVDPAMTRWAALERRNPSAIPAAVAVTRMLGRVGLDVRIAEDISARHVANAILGWRVLLRDLQNSKPTRTQAAQLVAEAELGLLRRRLIRSGRLKMMRWHAISRTQPV